MTTMEEYAFHEPNNTSSYFEGWYYKISDEQISFAIITGLHDVDGKREAFIQFIDTDTKMTRYITYDMSDVSMSYEPYTLKIGNSIFTKEHIILELDDIKAELDFSEQTPCAASHYAPTIMGPFSYVKQMQCIHSIISLHHHVNGILHVMNKIYLLDGIGYMEKDRGTSFPKEYIWFQSNICHIPNSCFFLSIAHIPFYKLSFTGCICVLMIDGKQLRFSTYDGCRIHYYDEHIFVLRQHTYELYIKVDPGTRYPLKAPLNGVMCVNVYEGLQGSAHIHLYRYGKLIGNYVFTSGGCEIH